MLWDLVFTIYHGIILMFIIGIIITSVLNTFVFKHPPTNVSFPAVKVSVLIPARNEERSIEACLASLLAQDCPVHEIILLDDRSEDATREIAERLGFSTNPAAPRRIMEGTLLPDGWTGKANACRQLASQATGDYLLFTDADTVHEPHCVRATVAYAESTGADLLSAWPRQETVTFVERLVIPLVGLLIFGFLPQWIVRLLQKFPALVTQVPPKSLRLLGAANGQFLLFKRSSYDAIGGHEAVKDHLVEDVALGRAIVERTGHGMRLVNCDGSRLLRCRMYQSAAEVWEGFTKNLRPAFETSSAMFFFSVLTQFLAFVLPWILLPFAGDFLPWIAAQVALVFVLRMALTFRFRTAWVSAVLHPFAHSWALAIALNSWWQWGRGGVTWKGRSYKKS